MAFYPAHCDGNCDGCSQNNGCGWCIFFDKPISTSVLEFMESKTRTTNYTISNLPEED